MLCVYSPSPASCKMNPQQAPAPHTMKNHISKDVLEFLYKNDDKEQTVVLDSPVDSVDSPRACLGPHPLPYSPCVMRRKQNMFLDLDIVDEAPVSLPKQDQKQEKKRSRVSPLKKKAFLKITIAKSRGSSNFKKSFRNSYDSDESPSSPGTPSSREDNDRYKTELCRSWEEIGFCRYGEKCQYAHGIEELREVARHAKYKSEFCNNFYNEGCCAYGKRCCFIHSVKHNLALVIAKDMMLVPISNDRLPVFKRICPAKWSRW